MLETQQWTKQMSLSSWNMHTAAAKSLQSCLSLCNPIDGSPLGSPVPGILQARTLEWVAISFSNAWKWKVKGKSLSHVRLFQTPWTAAHKAPPFMGFARQEYWSGVPLPSPTMEYYSAIKKNEIMPCSVIYMQLEIKIPSEVSLTDKYSHLWNLNLRYKWTYL